MFKRIVIVLCCAILIFSGSVLATTGHAAVDAIDALTVLQLAAGRGL